MATREKAEGGKLPGNPSRGTWPFFWRGGIVSGPGGPGVIRGGVAIVTRVTDGSDVRGYLTRATSLPVEPFTTVPATTRLPSGVTMNPPVCTSEPRPVTVVPCWPKVRSGEPSGLSRATAKTPGRSAGLRARSGGGGGGAWGAWDGGGGFSSGGAGGGGGGGGAP